MALGVFPTRDKIKHNVSLPALLFHVIRCVSLFEFYVASGVKFGIPLSWKKLTYYPLGKPNFFLPEIKKSFGYKGMFMVYIPSSELS